MMLIINGLTVPPGEGSLGSGDGEPTSSSVEVVQADPTA